MRAEPAGVTKATTHRYGPELGWSKKNLRGFFQLDGGRINAQLRRGREVVGLVPTASLLLHSRAQRQLTHGEELALPEAKTGTARGKWNINEIDQKCQKKTRQHNAGITIEIARHFSWIKNDLFCLIYCMIGKWKNATGYHPEPVLPSIANGCSIWHLRI